MTPRRPDGYLGIRHETRGSDIASVLSALLSPGKILGPDLHARVAAVTHDAWYPISLVLEVMDVIDAKLGRPSLAQMGRRDARWMGKHPRIPGPPAQVDSHVW